MNGDEALPVVHEDFHEVAVDEDCYFDVFLWIEVRGFEGGVGSADSDCAGFGAEEDLQAASFSVREQDETE